MKAAKKKEAEQKKKKEKHMRLRRDTIKMKDDFHIFLSCFNYPIFFHSLISELKKKIEDASKKRYTLLIFHSLNT